MYPFPKSHGFIKLGLSSLQHRVEPRRLSELNSLWICRINDIDPHTATGSGKPDSFGPVIKIAFDYVFLKGEKLLYRRKGTERNIRIVRTVVEDKKQDERKKDEPRGQESTDLKWATCRHHSKVEGPTMLCFLARLLI